MLFFSNVAVASGNVKNVDFVPIGTLPVVEAITYFTLHCIFDHGFESKTSVQMTMKFNLKIFLTFSDCGIFDRFSALG